jgi:hypothetical protein
MYIGATPYRVYRTDIQTWVDYHDVDKDCVPRTNESFAA